MPDQVDRLERVPGQKTESRDATGEFQEAPGEAEAELARAAFLSAAASSPGELATTLDRADPATRAAAVFRLQRERGNGFIQRVVQRQGAATAAPFDPLDPKVLQGAAQQVVQQEEDQVRTWIEADQTLPQLALNGMPALVFYVKAHAPQATNLPDARVNQLLTEWAAKHKRTIPPIPMFGQFVTRTLPAPESKHLDDDAVHLGLDVGTDPTNYQITAVLRNFNVKEGGDCGVSVDLLHEPSVSLQITPPPKSQAALQAAIALLNVHLRNHCEELVEASLSAQGSIGGSGGVQAQVELHVSTKVSFTVSSSVSAAPHSDDRDPTTVPLGTRGGVDLSWQPVIIGTLFHFN